MIPLERQLSVPSEPVSFLSRLNEQLQDIEIQLIRLLDAATIVPTTNMPHNSIFLFKPSYEWGPPSEEQLRLQEGLRKVVSRWFEYLIFLFHNVPDDVQAQIDDICEYIINLIERQVTAKVWRRRGG